MNSGITSGNPYIPASSPLFYGRSATMRALLRDEQNGQSVVILGGRRCGKTSLLRRIENFLSGSAAGRAAAELWREAVPDDENPPPPIRIGVHWPAYVNFQGIDFESYAAALQYLAKEIAESLSPLDGLTVPSPQGIAHASELEVWLHAVDADLDIRGLGGVALLLDEIQALFKYDWHHDFMGFLRRLDDTEFRTRIWIFLVGTDGLDKYRSPSDGSPALNTLRRVRLPDLDYRARRRMLVEPFLDRGRMAPDDAVLMKIDDLAGGNVWLLANLLEAVFDTDEMSITDVEEAAEAARDNLIDLFSRWANPLDETGWKIYRTVAASGHVATMVFDTDMQRSQRQILEYSGLLHRRRDGRVEIGPMLFLDWAVSNGKIEKPISDGVRRDPDGEAAAPGRYLYDVAISYAAPQVELARNLADEFKQLDLKVFFDRQVSPELWGVELKRHLPRTFDRDARVAVLLVSRDYVERYWPQLECRTLIERAVCDGWDAILLVSVDGTVLSGVPESIVVHRLAEEAPNVAEVAIKLAARLRNAGV